METYQSRLATNVGQLTEKFRQTYKIFSTIQMDIAHASSVNEVEYSLFYLDTQKDKLVESQHAYLKEVLERLRDHFLTKEDV